MKVSRSPDNGFKPFSISITIESEQEKEIFHRLFATNVSVPNLLVERKEIDKEHAELLRGWMSALAEKFNTIL